jgi:hypothetical protein
MWPCFDPTRVAESESHSRLGQPLVQDANQQPRPTNRSLDRLQINAASTHESLFTNLNTGFIPKAILAVPAYRSRPDWSNCQVHLHSGANPDFRQLLNYYFEQEEVGMDRYYRARTENSKCN